MDDPLFFLLVVFFVITETIFTGKLSAVLKIPFFSFFKITSFEKVA